MPSALMLLHRYIPREKALYKALGTHSPNYPCFHQRHRTNHPNPCTVREFPAPRALPNDFQIQVRAKG